MPASAGTSRLKSRSSGDRESQAAMDHHDPGDRFEAALRLAEDDPVRGAVALSDIVGDAAVQPDERFEAAARLAEVDEAQAADAFRRIVSDSDFDPDIRDEVAARLGEFGR